MSEKKLYPKKKKPRRDWSDKPWRVEYYLIYDGVGGADPSCWVGFYRSKISARIFAFWHYHIGSWGGSAVLIDNRKKESK